MSKRIISIFTAAFLLFACTVISAGVSAAADYSGAMGVLSGLNIGALEDESAIVTRGEFAGIISDIYNYNSRPYPAEGIFSDVTKKDANSGAIYYLTGRGIISGFADGTFRPDEPILFEQAVKILVCALGYDVVAERTGGYPSGYVLAASNNKILSGVSNKSGGTLTAGEVAQLVVNTLEADALIQSVFGEEKDYVVRKDITLMTEYMNIRKVNGIIKDNGITGLTGESKLLSNHILLNGEIYNAKSSGACAFLGYGVDAYVTMKDDGSTEDVVYMQCDNYTNAVIIKADRLLPNDGDFSVKNIVYEDIGGKKSKEKIDGEADFIYNGKAYTDLRANDLKIPYGELELIDNDGNDVFDVVMVKNARVIVADGISYNTDTVYDKNGGEPLKLEDVDEYKIIKDNHEISLADLSEWDVITAYESLDKQYINIEVSSAVKTGIVSRVYKEMQSIKVGDEYLRYRNSDILNSIELGKKYEFVLDIEGAIAAIKGQENSDNVVYFVDAKISDGLEGRILIKVFTTRGEHKVYTCTAGTRIDGSKNRTSREAVNYLKEYADGKLLNLILNDNDEVAEIILPFVGADMPETENGRLQFYFDCAGQSLPYSQNQQSFAGKLILSDTVKVFQIPTDRTAYDDYNIRGASYFGNMNAYPVQAYTIGEDDGRAEYLIYNADSVPQYTNSTYPVLVSKITNELDKDGIAREVLYGYGHQGEITYPAETDRLFTSSGIKPGDVVRCPLNIQGNAVDVRKIYDVDKKVIVSTSDMDLEFFNSCRSFAGDVFSRFDSLVGITAVDMSTASVADAKLTLEQHNVKGAKIYRVNTDDRNVVTPIAKEDIYDYSRVGKECFKAYLYSYDGNPRLLVVYEK